MSLRPSEANSRSVMPAPVFRNAIGTHTSLLRSAITRRSFANSLLSSFIVRRLFAQQRPRRIVSTAPSITEALFALGLGDEVVGVSIYCDFPPAVTKLPKVGTYLKPNVEAIARLAPDLVVLEKASGDLTDRLNALHIAFLEVPHGTLQDVYTGIESIALANKVPERGVGLVDQIKKSLELIKAKAKTMPSLRVLAILDRKQGTLTDLTAIGPDNYMNQILQVAGGTNVLDRPGLPHYPHISLETVIRENPDIILDLSSSKDSETERQVERAGVLALWQENRQLAAVRTGHVYFGTSNSLLVPGPRAPEAAQILFDYMHSAGRGRPS